MTAGLCARAAHVPWGITVKHGETGPLALYLDYVRVTNVVVVSATMPASIDFMKSSLP